MPSSAAWSPALPSSARVIVDPPGLTVTVTGPSGFAQSMLSAASGIGMLGVAETNEWVGSRRDVTIEFEHVSAPCAFRRLPVIVFASAGIVSPPARIRFLMARQSREGSCALSSAATPLTCGAAIDVPLRAL